MSSLTRVSEEHRLTLLTHVELLPKLADDIGTSPWPEVHARLVAEHAFLTSTLIPHMETVETAVHAELDRLLSCRLGMEPLEREHLEIRKLINRLGELADVGASTDPTPGDAIELNRVLVKLYSILRVHLREEALYVPILEHNLSPDQAEAIASGMKHAALVEL
jgi:hypothetical protein